MRATRITMWTAQMSTCPHTDLNDCQVGPSICPISCSIVLIGDRLIMDRTMK